MISKLLTEHLNEQLNYELYASHVYLSMAAYFADQSLDGFAHFFKVQSDEERFHAMKIYEYIHERGERVILSTLASPKSDFRSLLEPFEDALAQEKQVTDKFYHMSNLALDEREHATLSFLKWFIDEQVEEEETFDNLVTRMGRIANDFGAIYALDCELASRSFTPEGG